MSVIEDKEFFHLVTNRRMELGQIIDFSNDNKNTLYDFFFMKEYRNNNGSDVKGILAHNSSDNGIEPNIEDSNVVNGYMDNVSRSIRETIAEMVRLQSHPELPSRLSCLYVARNLDELMNWKDVFESYNRKVLQVVKVKSDGPYYVGDASKLPTIEGTSFNNKIKQAEEYWNGISEDVLPEVLLGGRIEIIEIVEEFS